MAALTWCEYSCESSCRAAIEPTTPGEDPKVDPFRAVPTKYPL